MTTFREYYLEPSQQVREHFIHRWEAAVQWTEYALSGMEGGRGDGWAATRKRK